MPYAFSLERYKEVVNFLNTLPKNISILEVGCGTGNILDYIVKETGIQDVYGIDIDEEALQIARKRGLKVFNLSILDDLSKELGMKFDVIIMGAVLHHLVGKTRNECLNLYLFRTIYEARMTISNYNLYTIKL